MAFEIEVRKNAFSSAKFYIDANYVRFDGKEILVKNIEGFGYMSTQTKVNGINTSKTFEIKIWQKQETSPTTFRFMGAFGGGAANDKYLTVTDQLWTYFGDELLKQLHRNLMDGKTIDFDSRIKLTSKGMIVRRKPLFGSAYEALGPWNDLNVSVYQGMLTVKGKTNKKAKIFEFLKEKNRWVLYHYINWLQSNPGVTQELMSIPNNYRLIDKV